MFLNDFVLQEPFFSLIVRFDERSIFDDER